MSTELRRAFHDRLARISQRVAGMGHSVCEATELVTVALRDGDLAIASDVIAGDTSLDATYAWIEEEIFDLVAREAPVARDLRFLMASMRVSQEFERCGDLVASTAKRVETVAPLLAGDALAGVVVQMGHHAAHMMRSAVQAYGVLDEGIAVEVVEMDDGLDDLHRDLLSRLFSRQSGEVGPFVDLALVGRFFERLGDHAVVVAQRVRFVSSGAMAPGDPDESTHPLH